MDDRLLSLEAKIELLNNEIQSGNLKRDIIDTVKAEIDDWLSGTLTLSCIREEIERRSKREKVDFNELIKVNKATQIDLQKIYESVNSLYIDFRGIRMDVDGISFELQYKALDLDLQRVDQELKHMCPMSYAHQLDAEVRTLAKNEDLINTQTSLKDLEKEVRSDYFNKEDARLEFEKIEQYFDTKFDKYVKVDKMHESIEKLNEQISEIGKVNHESKTHLIREMEKIRDMIAYNKHENTEKMTKLNVDISAELDKKCEKASFDILEADILKSISLFRKEIIQFERTQKEQEDVLIRFDEVLLQKASKLDIKDLAKKVSFLARFSNLEVTLMDLTSKVDYLVNFSGKTSNFIEATTVKLDDLAKENLRRASEVYEFKFMKEALSELQTFVSYKADRSEILMQLEQKASLTDLKNSCISFESLHKQIKLIIVHIAALQRILANPSNEKGPQRSKKEYFYKMTQRLMDFILASKISTEVAIPEELKTFFKEPLRVSTDPSQHTPRDPTPRARLFTPHRRYSLVS